MAASTARTVSGMPTAHTVASITVIARGSNPPALYDSSGKFYGYFTANKGKAQRADYELIDIICENYKKIRDDVSDWYDKIFNNY